MASPAGRPKIRLLRVDQAEDDNAPLSCTLRHRQADDKYVCLSYCWGDDKPNHSITVNGEDHPVRQNLFKFLHTAGRYRFDVLLWIDAICINQDDDREKAIHVPAMGQIFSEAEFVVVWLGLEDDDAKLLARMHDAAAFGDRDMPSLDPANSAASSEDQVFRKYDPALREHFDLKPNGNLATKPWLDISLLSPARSRGEWASTTETMAPGPHEVLFKSKRRWLFDMYDDPLLHAICDHPYFERAWVVQEIAKARNAWILTPPMCNPIEICVLLELLSCHVWALVETGDFALNKYAYHRETHKQLLSWAKSTGGARLAGVLEHMSRTKCTHKRDRLYSVLSMIDERDMLFEVDYSTTDEAFLAGAVSSLFNEHVKTRSSRVPWANEPEVMVDSFRYSSYYTAAVNLFKCMRLDFAQQAEFFESFGDLLSMVSEGCKPRLIFHRIQRSTSAAQTGVCVVVPVSEATFVLQFVSGNLTNVWMQTGGRWKHFFSQWQHGTPGNFHPSRHGVAQTASDTVISFK